MPCRMATNAEGRSLAGLAHAALHCARIPSTRTDLAPLLGFGIAGRRWRLSRKWSQILRNANRASINTALLIIPFHRTTDFQSLGTALTPKRDSCSSRVDDADRESRECFVAKLLGVGSFISCRRRERALARDEHNERTRPSSRLKIGCHFPALRSVKISYLQ
jgi:hypothetical protein